MTLDVLIGRALAFGVHPFAAWPRLRRRHRAALVAGYFGVSYAIVLTLLVVC